MIRTLTVIILLITNFSISAQTLFDLYLKLPEQNAMTDIESRKKMIAVFKSKESNFNTENGVFYYFDAVDHKNGYMTIAGTFEGSWSMCYWKLKNGNKLVAVLQIGCGPVCCVENFDFFVFDGLSLKKTKQPAVKSINDSDFFSYTQEKLNSLYDKYDMPMSLLFKLPQYGKNITALIYCEFDNPGSDFEKYLRPYQKGNRLTLKFQEDGIFTKGKLYTEEQE